MSSLAHLSRRLYQSFGVLSVLLLVVVGFSLFNFRRLGDANRWNIHSYQVLIAIQAVNESLYSLDSGVRGFVVSGKEESLLEFERGGRRYAENYAILKRLTADRLVHRQTLDLIQKQHDVFVEKRLLPVIALRRSISDPTRGIVATARLAPARREALSAMQTTLQTMERTERRVQEQREMSQETLQHKMEIALVLGSLLSITLTAGLFHLAVRSSRRLDDANLQLSAEKNRTEATNARLVSINARLEDEVTQRRAAEKRLQQGMVELQRSNAELEQFAYVASHDLQEPLRAVGGCVQLLQKRYAGQLDSRADQFIEHAVEGVQRMQNLIHDLLLYSRVGSKGKPFERVPGEKILAGALQNISVALREGEAKVSHDPLPVWKCEASQIELVFQNLLSNALKFRGDRAPCIHISCAPSDDSLFWVISVTDKGIGIETQYFERIFVMFQRLHNRTEYAGTGIGLAICKKIVERHGGTVWVKSEIGQGSTFFFSLPIEPSQERALAALEPGRNGEGNGPEIAESKSTN
ncbi:MAG TPA: ATP-binding protein [Abditibacterium sp.]|jgi:signal transduction histidine kinase